MRTLFFCTVLLIAIGGCLPEPRFGLTPEISNLEVNLLPFDTLKFTDSIRVTFDYRDGDGNIGLNTPDTLGAYLRYASADSATLNPFYSNLFVRFYAQNDAGKWDSIPADYNRVNPAKPIMVSRPYEARIQHLLKGEDEPIEGDVTYGLPGSFYLARFGGIVNPGYPSLKKGSKWYVKVQIADRKLNLSNVLYSSIQTVP